MVSAPIGYDRLTARAFGTAGMYALPFTRRDLRRIMPPPRPDINQFNEL